MKEYDLIVSLGGSCAVARQLQERGLRRVALPFDWLFSMSGRSLHSLAQCFLVGFGEWMREENLVPLKDDERRIGGAKYQYRDTATDYAFIHDFLSPASESITAVRSNFLRRFERFEVLMRDANRVALCFDAEWPGAEKAILEVREALKKRFGTEKLFDCYVWEFNAARYAITASNGVTCFRFTHPRHLFMYSNKSFEFDVMEGWSCSSAIAADYRSKSNLLYISRSSKGVKIWLLKNRKKILHLSLSVKTKRFDFWLGGM